MMYKVLFPARRSRKQEGLGLKEKVLKLDYFWCNIYTCVYYDFEEKKKCQF